MTGATQIVVVLSEGKIQLDANLGGVKFLTLFAILFPLFMFGFFAIAPYFSSSWSAEMQGTQTWYGLVFWVIFSPLISVWIRRRTVNALDDLISNAIVRAN